MCYYFFIRCTHYELRRAGWITCKFIVVFGIYPVQISNWTPDNLNKVLREFPQSLYEIRKSYQHYTTAVSFQIFCDSLFTNSSIFGRYGVYIWYKISDIDNELPSKYTSFSGELLSNSLLLSPEDVCMIVASKRIVTLCRPV